MPEKTKILVVDDHTLVRHGICRALQTIENFEVVGEADCGHVALTLIPKNCPDVVIMDINMPGLNGIETTKQILEINSNIKIIALSMHSEKIYVMGMLNSGASAYLLKTCAFKELRHSINVVLSGETYLCPEITRLVVNNSLNFIHGQKNTSLSTLTPREKEVLQLIAEGQVTKSIAQKLKILIVDDEPLSLKYGIAINLNFMLLNIVTTLSRLKNALTFVELVIKYISQGFKDITMKVYCIEIVRKAGGYVNNKNI